jgi:hypothetical protein
MTTRTQSVGLRNCALREAVRELDRLLEIEAPQVREAAEPFVSRLFPRATKVLRTEPLRHLPIVLAQPRLPAPEPRLVEHV